MTIIITRWRNCHPDPVGTDGYCVNFLIEKLKAPMGVST